jgi:hypothetical protein
LEALKCGKAECKVKIGRKSWRTGFEADRKDGQTDLQFQAKGRGLVEGCRS